MTTSKEQITSCLWRSMRLKYAAPQRSERTLAGADHEDYLGLENVESWTGKIVEAAESNGDEKKEEETALSSVFRKGDVLFGKLRPYLAKAWEATRDGVCSTEFLVLRPNAGIRSRFLLYSMLTPDFIETVYSSTFGAKMPRANWGFIGSIHLQFPPTELQDRIVEYLDYETSNIDRLVAEKKRMLALVGEKLNLVITTVVTRGRNPNSKMKASGKEWLGDVPDHWKVPRAKSLFREVDIRSESGEETLLSLRLGIGLVRHHDVSNKRLEPSDLIGFKKVESGQMVINRMRAASGLIAVATEPGLVSPDYAVFDVIDQSLSIEYFLELFRTELLQSVFRSASKGMGTGEQGFLRLYTENFLGLHFPYPPPDEQGDIVAFIKRERAEVAEMENSLVQSVALASERRAALIAAAVAGQLPLEEKAR